MLLIYLSEYSCLLHTCGDSLIACVMHCLSPQQLQILGSGRNMQDASPSRTFQSSGGGEVSYCPTLWNGTDFTSLSRIELSSRMPLGQSHARTSTLDAQVALFQITAIYVSQLTIRGREVEEKNW